MAASFYAEPDSGLPTGYPAAGSLAEGYSAEQSLATVGLPARLCVRIHQPQPLDHQRLDGLRFGRAVAAGRSSE